MNKGSESKRWTNGKRLGKRLAKRQLAIAVSSGLLAAATYAQEPTATEPDAIATSSIEELVVTARNRSERAQDVPVPISVIGGAQIDRDRAFTIADLTQRAPGLTATTPNARRTGVSIRGIGKLITRWTMLEFRRRFV